MLLLRAMHRLKPKLNSNDKERKVDSFMRTLSRSHQLANSPLKDKGLTFKQFKANLGARRDHPH